MKLMRVGDAGSEVPAIMLEDGQVRDVSSLIPDWSGENLNDARLNMVSESDLNLLPVLDKGIRIGSCVANVGKFVCIGLNYSDHAAEAGVEVPDEPILFMKATSVICGPDDGIEIPPGATKVDWEVELRVVIGTFCKQVDVVEALKYVAGYCVINDVSEMAYQLEGTGQWVKGKSYDSFDPIGPYLVTRSEVPDPQRLNMWLTVDGKKMQNGNTKTMVHTVADLISYVSKYMSLHPCDIIPFILINYTNKAQSLRAIGLKSCQE